MYARCRYLLRGLSTVRFGVRVALYSLVRFDVETTRRRRDRQTIYHPV